jgi:hypothetical protein
LANSSLAASFLPAVPAPIAPFDGSNGDVQNAGALRGSGKVALIGQGSAGILGSDGAPKEQVENDHLQPGSEAEQAYAQLQELVQANPQLGDAPQIRMLLLLLRAQRARITLLSYPESLYGEDEASVAQLALIGLWLQSQVTQSTTSLPHFFQAAQTGQSLPQIIAALRLEIQRSPTLQQQLNQAVAAINTVINPVANLGGLPRTIESPLALKTDFTTHVTAVQKSLAPVFAEQRLNFAAQKLNQQLRDVVAAAAQPTRSPLLREVRTVAAAQDFATVLRLAQQNRDLPGVLKQALIPISAAPFFRPASALPPLLQVMLARDPNLASPDYLLNKLPVQATPQAPTQAPTQRTSAVSNNVVPSNRAEAIVVARPSIAASAPAPLGIAATMVANTPVPALIAVPPPPALRGEIALVTGVPDKIITNAAPVIDAGQSKLQAPAVVQSQVFNTVLPPTINPASPVRSSTMEYPSSVPPIVPTVRQAAEPLISPLPTSRNVAPTTDNPSPAARAATDAPGQPKPPERAPVQDTRPPPQAIAEVQSMVARAADQAAHTIQSLAERLRGLTGLGHGPGCGCPECAGKNRPYQQMKTVVSNVTGVLRGLLKTNKGNSGI